MSDSLEVWQRPPAGLSLVAGWHQWADAGSVSSGLPGYLVEHTRAARIGRIATPQSYLFQIPGTHHLLRPTVRLAEGHRLDLDRPSNEIYLATAGGQEFLVFLGEEPHRDEAAYAGHFLSALEELGVRAVVTVAGVQAQVPHRRPRRVSCVYSVPELRPRLDPLNVRYSNYEGGATIGMLLAALAGRRQIELTRMCAHVPAYEFSAGTTLVRSMTMDQDHAAWHGLLVRINTLLGLKVDLSDLSTRCAALGAAWDEQIEELDSSLPHLQVYDHLDRINAEFDREDGLESGRGHGDLWDSALRDILDSV